VVKDNIDHVHTKIGGVQVSEDHAKRPDIACFLGFRDKLIMF
jgi:hypothetical protein